MALNLVARLTSTCRVLSDFWGGGGGHSGFNSLLASVRGVCGSPICCSIICMTCISQASSR